MMRRSVLRLFSILILFSVLRAWGQPPDWIKTAFDYDGETDSTRFLIYENHLNVIDSGKHLLEHKIAVFIGGERSAEEFQYQILPVRFNVKIKDLQVWYRNPGDKPQKIKNNQIEKFPDFTEYILYSDRMYWFWKFPGIRAGSILAWSYSEIISNPDNAGYLPIQQVDPVSDCKMTIKAPGDCQVQSFVVNGPESGPGSFSSIPSRDGEVSIHFTKLPGIPEEMQNAPYSEFGTYLVYRLNFHDDGKNPNAARDDWPQLSRSLYDYYFRDQEDISPELETLVNQITGSCSDQVCRIQKMSQWVQTQIRYVAVSIEEGGRRPHSATSIFTNKYGDCKDKANLLNVMLGVIDVEAWPVLTRTRTSWLVNPQFPMDQFNHAISAVDVTDTALADEAQSFRLGERDILLFDPTSDIVPLGSLPYVDEDQHMLVLAEGIGDLVLSPELGNHENIRNSYSRIHLTDGEGMNVLHSKSYSGQSAFRIINYLHSQNDDGEFLKRILHEVYPLAAIKTHGFSDYSHPVDSLHYSFEFSDPMSKIRAGSIFPFSCVLFGRDVSPETETDPHPVYLNYAFSEQDTTELVVDETFQILELPLDVTLSNSVGEYSILYMETDTGLQMIRFYQIYKRVIPKDKFHEYLSLVETQKKGDRGIVLLTH